MDRLTYNDDAIKALGRKLAELNDYSTKLLPEMLQHQAKELADALFLTSPRASAAVIQARVQSLGWRFIRAPKSYAVKLSFHLARNKNSRTNYGKQRWVVGPRKRDAKGRFIKGGTTQADITNIQNMDREKGGLTLEELQFAAINFRISHINYLATTWVPAMAALGSKLNVAGKRNNHRWRAESSVEIEGMSYVSGAATAGSIRAAVTIVNKARGVVVVDRQEGFVAKAVEYRIADIDVYIRRKMNERATIFNRSGLLQGAAA